MRRLLPFILASSLSACIVNTDESQTSQNAITHNMLAANMLAANMLAANMLAANMLAANDLNSNTLALNGSSANLLLSSSDGQTVLTYLVSCALPAGTTLTAVDPNTNDTLTFYGEIGLAPAWLKKPLDPVGQEWVSACVYARCNAFGVAVPISIRGSNNALVTDPSEKSTYTVQDGAFYGNLFIPGATQPEWFACSGVDNATAETLGRECATPDGSTGKTVCGFTYTGECNPPHGRRGHSDNRSACSTFNNGGTYYSSCTSYPDVHLNTTGNHGAAEIFNPVITAYAKP